MEVAGGEKSRAAKRRAVGREAYSFVRRGSDEGVD